MSSVPSRPRPVLFKIGATLLLLLAASLAQALPDDREQPIRITADKALRDEKKGFTLYMGNVIMDQGSLHIEADRITVYHESEQADKIVAKGKPARLKQRPDPAKGPVQAHAEVIEYYKSEDRVHLRSNASIQQDGSTVTGDSINYYISEQRVRADSDRAREDSRVEVVIPAQALEETDGGDSGTTDGE